MKFGEPHGTRPEGHIAFHPGCFEGIAGIEYILALDASHKLKKESPRKSKDGKRFQCINCNGWFENVFEATGLPGWCCGCSLQKFTCTTCNKVKDRTSQAAGSPRRCIPCARRKTPINEF